MRILIAGGHGQLGVALSRRAQGHEVIALGRDTLDVTRLEARDTIVAARPDLVINAAAYTNVDGCEDDPDRAYRVNALGARNIALGASCIRRSEVMQRDEIGLMQRWLRERELPVPEVDDAGNISMMGGMSGMRDMHMPGMLSQAQLTELGNARGEEYDRLFLTYMIQHHNGAVTMVHELFAADGAAQDNFVFKLASDIQVDQTTEVARMQQMLDAISRTPQ